MKTQKMEIDNILISIQNSCDSFISQNIENVLVQLEKNMVTINTDFSEFKIDKLESNSWGVYVFYSNPKMSIANYEDLNNLWQTNKDDKRLHSPMAIKGRFKSLTKGELACMYVGKSEDLLKRISQHIHQTTKYTTYGLKISEHDRLHGDFIFSYSYFVIKNKPSEKYKDGMKCLIVTLEKHLREKLRPLFGKQ